MIIDTHAHLNFNSYKDDSDKIIEKSLSEGFWMINVGSQYSTSRRAVEMAKKYPEGIYAAVGLHPIHLETKLLKVKNDPEEVQFQTREESFDYEKYKELAKDEKVVAIGEIGLDYYWKPKSKAKLEDFKNRQRELLSEEIKLSEEVDLPVIFHCRMAHDGLIEILKKHPGLRGVIHCFTGTWEHAQEYMSMGFYLGFNGMIFKMDLDEVIKKTPLDKILVETDCPYLTPPQESGRNEPAYVKHVIERIAKIKNLSYKEISWSTTENAKRLFNIKEGGKL